MSATAAVGARTIIALVVPSTCCPHEQRPPCPLQDEITALREELDRALRKAAANTHQVRLRGMVGRARARVREVGGEGVASQRFGARCLFYYF